MQKISSKTVCDLYYVIFVIYAILGVLAVINVVAVLFSKLPLMLKIAVGGQGLIMAGVLVVLSMFQYIVCDRALLSSKVAEGFYVGKASGATCNVNEDCASNNCDASIGGKCA